ncbi:unnamed protein product [Ectocarpus sp. 8 AP-2014]
MVKSAGSTIRNILYTATQEEGLPAPPVCLNDHSESACHKAINSSAIITGFAESIRRVRLRLVPLEVAHRDCDYFTVMRHPIDRLVSAFFYCPKDHDLQNRPPKWCGDAEDSAPMSERLLEYAQRRWKNKAFTQMTFGLYCPPGAYCDTAKPGLPPALCEPEGQHVLQQVETILAGYRAIGIMEHWGLSMQLFNARVRSPVRDWNVSTHVNPGGGSGIRDEVLQWAHQSPAIHDALRTDMLLYSFALSIFKQQTTDALGTDWFEGASPQ